MSAPFKTSRKPTCFSDRYDKSPYFQIRLNSLENTDFFLRFGGNRFRLHELSLRLKQINFRLKLLLYCYRLCKVSWLVNICTKDFGNIVCKQLRCYVCNNWCCHPSAAWNIDNVVYLTFKAVVTL